MTFLLKETILKDIELNDSIVTGLAINLLLKDS
jgi:hypothetical protein